MNLILRERSFSDSHTDLARFRRPAREGCSRCTGLGNWDALRCEHAYVRGDRPARLAVSGSIHCCATLRGWFAGLADCGLRIADWRLREGRWGRDLVMGIGFYVDDWEESVGRREQRGGTGPEERAGGGRSQVTAPVEGNGRMGGAREKFQRRASRWNELFAIHSQPPYDTGEPGPAHSGTGQRRERESHLAKQMYCWLARALASHGGERVFSVCWASAAVLPVEGEKYQ